MSNIYSAFEIQETEEMERMSGWDSAVEDERIFALANILHSLSLLQSQEESEAFKQWKNTAENILTVMGSVQGSKTAPFWYQKNISPLNHLIEGETFADDNQIMEVNEIIVKLMENIQTTNSTEHAENCIHCNHKSTTDSEENPKEKENESFFQRITKAFLTCFG